MALSNFNCNFTKVTDLSPLGGAPLNELNCEHTGITDLGPLRGTPIVRLICSNTKITDLSPLQRMASLTSFKCAFTPVRDLTPLAGLKLVSLDIRDSQVTDLSVLRGLPLERLYMSYTKVRDLSPLAGSTTLALLECYATGIADFSPLKETKIRDLNCDFLPQRDTATIAGIHSLQRLNGASVTQFKELQAALGPTVNSTK
jgi:Leucine-rich repeat (LRR) protein